MIETETVSGNGTLVVLIDDRGFTLPEDMGASLLLIKNVDWNRDLSPWRAPKVFRNGEDFGEGAGETLTEILKAMDEITHEKAILAGYSLAGLFALYAGTKTAAFDACVSALGSLWFPSFDTWLMEHPMQCGYVYLSLGDQEKNTRNVLMSSVEDRTRQAHEIISKTARCDFEMNPGNHFREPDERLRKGIRKAYQAIHQT